MLNPKCSFGVVTCAGPATIQREKRRMKRRERWTAGRIDSLQRRLTISLPGSGIRDPGSGLREIY
jgi:hypothetical protein